MLYVSGSSDRTAVELSKKWLEQRSRLVKTEKVMAGKACWHKRDLITSRWVLNTLARVSGKEILTARYRLFIMLHSYIELRRTIE